MSEGIIVNDNIVYVVKWFDVHLFSHRNVDIAFDFYKKALVDYGYDGVSLECEDLFPF